jgi:hypothetical protein
VLSYLRSITYISTPTIWRSYIWSVHSIPAKHASLGKSCLCCCYCTMHYARTSYELGRFGSPAPVLSSFKKIKIFLQVAKKSKNNFQDYQWYISQSCKILTRNSFYFVLDKSDKIWYVWEISKCLLRSTLLSFLCRSEYKVFEVDFTRLWNTTLTIYGLFLEFFETQKYDFLFKKQDHWCPCAPNLCPFSFYKLVPLNFFCFQSFSYRVVGQNAARRPDHITIFVAGY